jgi:type VI secretion system protein ImpA
MAKLDLASLVRPVSEEQPCGADLDLEGDAAYLHFVAAAEGMLPRSFFTEVEDSTGERIQRPFDRSSIDFNKLFNDAAPIVAQTHDLRLLVLLAKFYALNRDLTGLGKCLEAAAQWLEAQWDDVHPRAEDGDYVLRIVALESLTERVPVLLPLQFVPLVTHKRFGSVSYRSHMMATGQIPAGNDKLTSADIERAMAEADFGDLIALRNDFGVIQKALARIMKACNERMGIGKLDLGPLTKLIGQIFDFIEEAIVKRDPSRATASSEPAQEEDGTQPSSEPPALPQDALPSIEAAVEALAAATDYFRRTEPSNPGLLLLWQAQALVGKSFLDAVQLLVPAQAQRAVLRIGADTPFDLPIEKLAALAPTTPVPAADKPTGDTSFERPLARTRQEANTLLERVAAFYRTTEPSSAIPLLADRARAFSGKDFMALLAEVLPKKA